MDEDISPERQAQAQAILARILSRADPADPLARAMLALGVERLAPDLARKPEDYLARTPEGRPAATPPPAAGPGLAQVVKNARLPAVPQILVRLQEALNSPYASNTDIARIIQLDTALAASVLQLVNSALYGLEDKVESVQRAIMVLGAKQIYALAVGNSVVKTMSRVFADRAALALFWEHSVACAILARDIAILSGRKNPDRHFLAGLLHDIGRLALMAVAPAQVRAMEALAEAEGLTSAEAEVRVLGYGHAELGGELLRHWSVPEPIPGAVAAHHDPFLAEDPRDGAAIHLADFMARALVVHPRATGPAEPLSREAWETLGVELKDLVELVGSLDERIQDTLSVLLSH